MKINEFYENIETRSMVFLELFRKHMENACGAGYDHKSYDDMDAMTAAEITKFISLNTQVTNSINGSDWTAQIINSSIHRLAKAPGSAITLMSVMVFEDNEEKEHVWEAVINIATRSDIINNNIPEVLYKAVSGEPITMSFSSHNHDDETMCVMPMWDFYALPTFLSHLGGYGFSMHDISDVDIHHQYSFGHSVENVDGSHIISISREGEDDKIQKYKFQKIAKGNESIKDIIMSAISGSKDRSVFQILNHDNNQILTKCESCSRWHVQIVINLCMDILITDYSISEGFTIYNRSGLDTTKMHLFVNSNGEQVLSSNP